MSHKRNGSQLARIRTQAGYTQDQVAESLGIGGGKVVWSQFETGRLLLPLGLITPLASLLKTRRKRIVWAAVNTYRKGLTMEKYRALRQILVDYTSDGR